jgi:hypothetical protein
MNEKIEAGRLLVITRNLTNQRIPAPFFMDIKDVGRGTVQTFIEVNESVVALEPQTLLKGGRSVVKVLSARGVGWVYVDHVA